MLNISRRFHNRNWLDLLHLASLYLHNIWHFTTPKKLANYLLIKIQKQRKDTHLYGMPYRYRIEPINVAGQRR